MNVPRSDKNLVINNEKCAGCLSCMLACTLVHEGEENLSLARIQVIQNSFGTYPKDINIAFCRQCAKPRCIEACPTGAACADAANGNIRVIDTSKCNGCQKCIEACPFKPQSVVWDSRRKVALKCDLCLHTTFWSKQGKQACVEVCPMKAIKLESKDVAALS